MGEWELFIGALVVVYLVPGPDMVLILQTGATAGRGSALATALGFAFARAAHVALAALGLATLLVASPVTFEIVRFAGAAYLIWLGIEILHARSLVPGMASPATLGHTTSYGSDFNRGLLTNVLNPKALLFCSVLLPQFVQPGEDSVGGQFLVLGIILVGVGLVFDIAYASIGFGLGRWISRHPLIQTLQRWVLATVLVGFGLRLLLSSHPL